MLSKSESKVWYVHKKTRILFLQLPSYSAQVDLRMLDLGGGDGRKKRKEEKRKEEKEKGKEKSIKPTKAI